jgi:signal transduction histidine kinase
MNDRDADFSEYLTLAQVSAEQLVEEIAGQRALLEAEKGTLQLETQPVVIRDLLASVIKTYQGLAQTRGLGLSLSEDFSPVTMTDPTLLKRVVSNLVKNAIEASNEGETVTLTLREDNTGVDILVWNPKVLSEEVYANLFKRSFSTKGTGRGLGTYGSRIFVEEYLGGAISCASEAGKGTTFTVHIPPSFPPKEPL